MLPQFTRHALPGGPVGRALYIFHFHEVKIHLVWFCQSRRFWNTCLNKALFKILFKITEERYGFVLGIEGRQRNCKRDQIYLCGMPGRRRGADRSWDWLELGNFVVLLRILSRHVGPYFGTCRNMCPCNEPSLPKWTNSCQLLTMIVCVRPLPLESGILNALLSVDSGLPAPSLPPPSPPGCSCSMAVTGIPTPEGLGHWGCHQKHKLCEGLAKKEIPMGFNLRRKAEAGCKPLSLQQWPKSEVFKCSLLIILKERKHPLVHFIFDIWIFNDMLNLLQKNAASSTSCVLTIQDMIHGPLTPASPGSVFEMQNRKSFPGHTESESAF